MYGQGKCPRLQSDKTKLQHNRYSMSPFLLNKTTQMCINMHIQQVHIFVEFILTSGRREKEHSLLTTDPALVFSMYISYNSKCQYRCPSKQPTDPPSSYLIPM